MNKSQLQDGLTNQNQKITPKYSPAYAAKKGFSTPDLKLTGDFYSEFDLPEQSGTFFFRSGDFKTPFLVDRYGRDIFGLIDDNFKRFVDNIFYPKMMRKIKQYV